MVLLQVKEVGAVTQKEISSECRTLAYMSIVLTILGLGMVTILHYRKSKFCRRYTFSNAVKIMVFISVVQNYIPIKLCKTAGSIHLFKITGTLKAECPSDVPVTFNENKINLSRVVPIKLPRQNQSQTFDE